MPKPSEFAVHLLIVGGHREEIKFPTLEDFQNWYKTKLLPAKDSTDFVNVPIKNIQGEYMVIRPSSIQGIRVEPVFSSSVDRF
jgi:hypothetical protein